MGLRSYCGAASWKAPSIHEAGKNRNHVLHNARVFIFPVCIAALIQFITACGGGGSDEINGVSLSDQDPGTPTVAATVGGMYDTATLGLQHMQSPKYVADGKISFGSTQVVYATSNKYRMQSQPLSVSMSH